LNLIKTYLLIEAKTYFLQARFSSKLAAQQTAVVSDKLRCDEKKSSKFVKIGSSEIIWKVGKNESLFRMR
jgi:hypothetical protein